jgi:hypothetical protein
MAESAASVTSVRGERHGRYDRGPGSRRGLRTSPGLARCYGRLLPGPLSLVYRTEKCSALQALCFPVCAVSPAAGV